MEDARGKRYKDLKVAFRHRKLYDEACTCKAQPWDEAALARHRQFAATAERKKSGRKGEASPTRIGRIDQTGSGAPGSATTAAGVAMLVAPVDLPLPSAAERRAEKLAAITRSLPRAKEQADSGWIGRWQPMLPAGLQALGEKRRQSLVPARVPRPETAMRRTWPRDQSPLDAGRVPRQSRPLPIPAPAQSAAEGPVPAARGAPAAAKTSGQRTSARARATPAVAVRPAGRAPRKLADGSETHVQ